MAGLARLKQHVCIVFSIFRTAFSTSSLPLFIVALAGGAAAAAEATAWQTAEGREDRPPATARADEVAVDDDAAALEELADDAPLEDDEATADGARARAVAGIVLRSSFFGGPHKGVSSIPWNQPRLMPMYNKVSNNTPWSGRNSLDLPQKLKNRLSFTSFLTPPQYFDEGRSSHKRIAKSSVPKSLGNSPSFLCFARRSRSNWKSGHLWLLLRWYSRKASFKVCQCAWPCHGPYRKFMHIVRSIFTVDMPILWMQIRMLFHLRCDQSFHCSPRSPTSKIRCPNPMPKPWVSQHRFFFWFYCLAGRG